MNKTLVKSSSENKLGLIKPNVIKSLETVTNLAISSFFPTDRKVVNGVLFCNSHDDLVHWSNIKNIPSLVNHYDFEFNGVKTKLDPKIYVSEVAKKLNGDVAYMTSYGFGYGESFGYHIINTRGRLKYLAKIRGIYVSLCGWPFSPEMDYDDLEKFEEKSKKVWPYLDISIINPRFKTYGYHWRNIMDLIKKGVEHAKKHSLNLVTLNRIEEQFINDSIANTEIEFRLHYCNDAFKDDLDGKLDKNSFILK